MESYHTCCKVHTGTLFARHRRPSSSAPIALCPPRRTWASLPRACPRRPRWSPWTGTICLQHVISAWYNPKVKRWGVWTHSVRCLPAWVRPCPGEGIWRIQDLWLQGKEKCGIWICVFLIPSPTSLLLHIYLASNGLVNGIKGKLIQ